MHGDHPFKVFLELRLGIVRYLLVLEDDSDERLRLPVPPPEADGGEHLGSELRGLNLEGQRLALEVQSEQLAADAVLAPAGGSLRLTLLLLQDKEVALATDTYGARGLGVDDHLRGGV